MDNPLSLALSGQSAYARRLDTIAGNIANMNTVGFRADGVSFRSVVTRAGETALAFAATGETAISTENGAITETGGALDFAINGDAWFSVATPDGASFTRDGRFQLSETGELTTLEGKPVLDIGGGPISLDLNGGKISVTGNGDIRQDGRFVSTIGLFRIEESATLTRTGPATFTTNRAPELVRADPTVSVLQGHVEQSNVDPMTEMARLIAVTRAFETAQNMVRTGEELASRAIRELGPRG